MCPAAYFGDVTVINFDELDKDGENGTILQRVPVTDEVRAPLPLAFCSISKSLQIALASFLRTKVLKPDYESFWVVLSYKD